MGNQQTCCFRKLLQRRHSPRCVPYLRMVNGCCDCSCCHRWYRQASSVMTGCGFVVVSLEAVSTCLVMCGKRMGPCVVSMTTLLVLIKCNPIIGPVNLLIATRCSAKVLSPFPKLSLVVANGFSNWPLVTCIWKLGGTSTLRILFGAFSFIVSKLFWVIALTNVPDPPKHQSLGYSQNPEALRAFLVFASGLL